MTLSERVEAALAAAGVEASVGLALRDPRSGLAETVEASDRAMYAVKFGRRDREPVAG